MRSAGFLSRVSFAIALAIAVTGCNGDDSVGFDGGPTTSPAASSETASGNGGPGTSSDNNPALPDGEDAIVGTIVDGDTLRTTDQVRVRLLNIDTPEPTQRECWATEATARLRELAPPGTSVRLVFDRERFDRYGRTLAHVFRTSDGLWVNEQLALDGAALPYVLQPNDARYQPIVAAAEEARRAGRGLWGSCTTAGGATANMSPGGTTTTSAAEVAPDRPGCEPAYPTVCIAPSPPDLDCADIPHRRFTVLPPDPHRFDGGGDGVGCERN